MLLLASMVSVVAVIGQITAQLLTNVFRLHPFIPAQVYGPNTRFPKTGNDPTIAISIPVDPLGAREWASVKVAMGCRGLSLQ